MIFVWIALIAIGALIVVSNVVGFFLPERYLGRARCAYDRSCDDVWSALHDVEAHPMTGKMKKTTEVLPGENGLPAWAETMAGNERISVKTTHSEEPTKLVREMESAAMPMTSRWEYSLEATDGGCQLTLEGETFIRRGSWIVPMFRFMMVVGGGVKKGLVIQMRMVANTLGGSASFSS